MISGYPNCPSGYDESSRECGATRKLMELPAGLYAALGCLAAGIAACLIFCMVGIARRRKDPPEPKYPATTTMLNGTYTLPKTNGDTLKKDSLFYNHDHDSWHTLQPVEYVDYVHVDRETTVWPPPDHAHYESFYYTNEIIDYDNSIYNNHRQPSTFTNKLNYLVTILYLSFKLFTVM